MKIRTRELRRDEIPLLTGLPPKEWNLDINGIFSFFYGNPHFRCIAALDGDTIAGISACYIYSGSAWLGQVIVREDYRKHGIGFLVTDEIIRYCKGHGSRSILLTATPLGKILYKKLGFREITEYIFYENDALLEKPVCSLLGKFSPDDFNSVCALDYKITGEDRRNILKLFCNGGAVYKDKGRLTGFYFDHFRNGAVMAESVEAGFALLQYKHSSTMSVSVCPAENVNASSFLLNHGFSATATGTRMILGDDVTWEPVKIYSRMAAYLG
jgi:GNAT superfamily N-acetyltransferase